MKEIRFNNSHWLSKLMIAISMLLASQVVFVGVKAQISGDIGLSEAQNLANLGLDNVKAGEWGKASENFRRSSQSASSEGNNALASQSDYNLALVLQRISGGKNGLAWVEYLKSENSATNADFDNSNEVVRAATRASRLAKISNLDELSVKASVLAVNYDNKLDDETAFETLQQADELASNNRISKILIAEAAINRFAGNHENRFQELAFRSLNNIISTTEKTSNDEDAHLKIIATGLMGRLYAVSNRLEDGLVLTSEALLLLDNNSDQETILQLEIQKALILQRLGRTNDALNLHENITSIIKFIRPSLAVSDANESREAMRDLISEELFTRVDLMLEKDGENQATLYKVREVLELNKLMDLEAYFAKPCVKNNSDKIIELEQLANDVAVIYPVVLKDRVEVIYATSKNIKRYIVNSNQDEIVRLSRDLRENLLAPIRQNSGNNVSYLPNSQRLYDILVRPAIQDLNASGIKTLVFAPDYELRSIPLSALNDGQNFLIEKFAISTALGLNLVDPRPLSNASPNALLVGLNVDREVTSANGDKLEFKGLENVGQELNSISNTTQSHTILNEGFTHDGLSKSISDYRPNIIHIATHGQFSRLKEDNFIVTYDGKLTPDDMSNMIESAQGGNSLELLGLSACETAVGDGDAILGLAGVAYQSGARSVFGSLWTISDVSTSKMMPNFYSHIVNDKMSKAEALRQAQIEILNNPETSHPYYWSAFIILGNWL